MSRSNLLAIVIAIICVGGLIAGGWVWYSTSLEPQLASVRNAVAAGKYEEAASQVEQVIEQYPDSVTAHELAARIATEREDEATALTHYKWLFENGGDAFRYASDIADLHLSNADFDKAEEWYFQALEVDPDAHGVISRLTRMLSDQGRRWEAHELLMRLVRSGQFEVADLVLAGQTENMLTLSREYIAQRYADREQVGPLLGVARFGMAAGDHRIAEELLREVIRKRPDLIEAPIRLCKLIREQRPADFPAVFNALPAGAQEHPAYWVELGKWYRSNGEPRHATACFAQALRIDPNRQFASFALGQLLTQFDREELASEFRDRSEKLSALTANLAKYFSGELTIDDTRAISDQLLELGRYWESAAWAQYALDRQHFDWSTRRLRRLRPFLRPSLAEVRADFNPVTKLTSTDWPVPTAADFQTVANRLGTGGPADTLSPVRFRNVAVDQGLSFQYFNGAVAGREVHRMYEFTGGGVGVIDYDLDGWPDMYLPNGTEWPAAAGTGFTDALFRNLAGGFENVTEAAGIAEFGFGQGVAIGDFDADGFPDVYVANTNRNQLWRNNGDGTFTDVTEASGLTTSVWTSSALIADLNADGLPDIYDVNFLGGDDVFTRVCEVDGRPRSCQPDTFPGEQDRVFLNRGDGTFVDVTESSGVVRPKGNGLGIIAADFDGSGRLNLFLANDSVPNFYYQNESTDDSILFAEAALLCGLDVDYQGESQACMGVGIADVDANGLPDLFITNFHDESNTLYLQQSANVFSDECRPSGIRNISRKLLGFGTQFLDVDLNGFPDLIITNGHVDDFRADDIPYQMPPQLLRHEGGAAVTFVEQKPAPADDYFSGQYLGRGLARLDFDRDGLDDFAVSHLDAPAALVRNETEEHGDFVSIRLVATRSDRQAIGSVIRVKRGDATFSTQLTAGDGYMASNERRLTVGVGSGEGPCEVQVKWISGETEVFGTTAANTHVIAVEGTGALLNQPR